jgi:alkanesulfonate monooxygenase SsuD/methylene tetrahydromethanopterin reductase-like flavin-dependent oxidoreductase (luciferase family)
LDEALEHTRIAESLGLSRAWYAEHHFSNYSICPSPLMFIAYAAGLTKKIRLGTAVIVPPLYTPARLLAEIALVDTFCDGRLDLGVGSGYQHYEFERFGVDLDKCKEMTGEMLDMIELGLSNPSFEYSGVHYTQPKTAINVRPIQHPHPPIWNASKDESSVRRAARMGYSQFFSSRFASLEELIPVRRYMDDMFREEGRDPDSMHLGLLSYCCVSDDKDVIANYVENACYQQRISRSLRERRATLAEDYWVAEQPFDPEPTLAEAAGSILAGDVDTVAERALEIFRAVRPSHAVFYFKVGDVSSATAARSMELWTGEVVPRIEKAIGMPIAEFNNPKPRERTAPITGVAVDVDGGESLAV